MEVFDDRGPRENENFCIFTILQILQPNEWIFIFYVSWCHIMMILFNLKGFWKNRKKTEIFHDRGPVEKCHFLHIHIFADFAAKWVNFYFLGILMSYYDDFLQFKRLSKKSKKLKFSMTADLGKNEIFCIFTILQILQPNEWIFIF